MVKIVSEEIMARLVLARFLANGFGYPDAHLLSLLSEEGTYELLLGADEVLGLKAEPVVIALRSWAAGCDDQDSMLLELQVEHTYLFITARPHVPAPPYESAYNGRGLLMGEPVSQVLAAYDEAGLTMHRDFDALPDHVAAELEFAAYLLQQEMEAEQGGDALTSADWRRQQQRFWQDHLLLWGPAFLERVQTGARLPFYRLLANLAEALFNAEERRFPMTALGKVEFEEETHG